MLETEVKEIQGLYGPFTLSERVLQKIWLKGDFDQKGLTTDTGVALSVVDPGRWNHLEGPDFLDAVLEIGGERIVGDVEVHFKANDWFLHKHENNPNFDRVCLHVLLYGDASLEPVVTQSGFCPPSLSLMRLLERDLEDYTIDEALLEMEQVEETAWMKTFLSHPLDERLARLEAGALKRWERKCAFARKRLSGASWREACHQYCLEVLGYARNRAPMSRLALAFSIEDFAAGRAEPDALFEQEGARWRLSGLRPANHPKNRLRQYAELCRERPDWPERLHELFKEMTPAHDASLVGAAFRRHHGLNSLLRSLATDIFAGCIRAKRLNTLICDGFLPLVRASGVETVERYWLNWPAGDGPDRLYRFLKQAAIISRETPYANGQLQGGLHLVLKG